MRLVCGLSMVGVFVAGVAAAGAKGPDNPHVWKPDVRSVAVFKNGMGFYIRDGEVKLRDGWCVAGAVPPAVFGTLAIYSLNEEQVVDVVGAGPGETVEFDGKDGPADLTGKLARLRASKGLRVALTYKHGDQTLTAAGVLTEVANEDALASSKSPNAFAILEKDGQLSATRVDELTKLEVMDQPLRIHAEGKPKEDGRARLGMAYLRKGVTWIPEYTLKIVDEQSAELTLRATLINEAEDLIGTDVHFVVGVPSFMHSEFLTPIAVGQVIRTVAAALPPGFQSQMISNSIATRAGQAADQRSGAVETVKAVPAGEDSGRMNELMRGLPQMGGAGGSDFTVYTKQAMTVRKGEKAIVTLFRHKIAYSHYYRWASPGDMRHYLVLRNGTDTPWTTGPVVAVSERRPLCQDTIKYTPRGSDYELPITTAVNVATGSTESEVDRKLKAHEPAANVFLDLVTIEGRVKVHNYEKRAIDLEVRRTVPGALRTASDDGRTWQDTGKLKLTEREGAVTWTLKLQPGEGKELTYRYERYVGSQ